MKDTLLRLALGAVLLIGSTTAGHAQDAFERAKQLREIQKQKLNETYKETLNSSYRTARTDPAKAVQILKLFLRQVRESDVVSLAEKGRMVDALQARIDYYEKKKRDADRKARNDAFREPAPVGNRPGLQAQPRDGADFQTLYAEMRRLRREGRTAEARRLEERISAKYGDLPITGASDQISRTANLLQEQRDLERQRSRRADLVRREVVRSSMPPIGDIEFPDARKWRELTKLRSPLAKIDARTKKILRALNTPITLEFEDQTLEDVINFIGKKYDIALVIDPLSMRELGIEYDTKVTMKSRGLTLRTFLRKMLGDLGMSYYVENGSINIMSVERAKARMSIRVYYLGDLVRATNPQFGFGLYGQRLNAIQQYQQIVGLIQMVVSTVDPDSWAINGGQGTIAYSPATSSLIVKQSAEVHLKLGGGRALQP